MGYEAKLDQAGNVVNDPGPFIDVASAEMAEDDSAVEATQTRDEGAEPTA